MSADGSIEIAVNAEGADEAATNLAEGDGDGGMAGGGMGGGGGGGGAGGLRGNMKSGAIAGVLMAAIGPLLDVLSPMLKILSAFLAPLAVFLMRLFQPVLRVLIRLLPAWMEFIRIANRGIPKLQQLLVSLPGKIWDFMTALPGQIWDAITSGASWIANGASSIGTAVWKAISGGAEWFADGASSIGSAVWTSIKSWANTLKGLLKDIPDDIVNFMKKLPEKIAKALPSFGSGGVVGSPTLATVGEAGPEAIIPLDKLENMMAQQGGGGDTAVNISGGLSPFVKEITRSSQVDL